MRTRASFCTDSHCTTFCNRSRPRPSLARQNCTTLCTGSCSPRPLPRSQEKKLKCRRISCMLRALESLVGQDMREITRRLLETCACRRVPALTQCASLAVAVPLKTHAMKPVTVATVAEPPEGVITLRLGFQCEGEGSSRRTQAHCDRAAQHQAPERRPQQAAALHKAQSNAR